MASRFEAPEDAIFFHGLLDVLVWNEALEDGSDGFMVAFNPALSAEQAASLLTGHVEASFMPATTGEEDRYAGMLLTNTDARQYAFEGRNWNGEVMSASSTIVKAALGQKIYETLSNKGS